MGTWGGRGGRLRACPLCASSHPRVHPRPALAPLCKVQVKTFKMARKAPFSELRRLVADQMGVPLERQRFWRWAQRQNATYRPAQVLVLDSEDQPISVSAARRGVCTGLSRPG